MRAWAAIPVVMTAALMSAGCGNFFSPPATSGGGGSGSGLNSVYVANANPQLDSVAAFSLAGGALTSLANSPYTLGVIPSAMALNPAGSLLWVGSQLGGIFAYVVNSDGSLTLSGNQAVASASASSMTVDATGQWLLVLSNAGSGAGPAAYVYQINSTNGALTPVGNPTQLDAGSAGQIVLAPNQTQVYASLGTGGVDALTFDPSTGSLVKLNVLLSPRGSSFSDQGLAIDPAGSFLFVAETGTNGVRVLGINADSTLTAVTGSPYATGLGAVAVTVEKTGGYLYVANSAANTISAFALASNGTLTQLAGSPFATGSSPYSMAEDNTDGYLLVACTGGSPDLQVFGITGATGTTPGALTSAQSVTTGSVSPAAAVAVVTSP